MTPELCQFLGIIFILLGAIGIVSVVADKMNRRFP